MPKDREKDHQNFRSYIDTKILQNVTWHIWLKATAKLFSSNYSSYFNPHTPVAQKLADEVVFHRFQGEGVEFFFKSDLTDPPQIFVAHLLESDGFIAYPNE